MIKEGSLTTGWTLVPENEEPATRPQNRGIRNWSLSALTPFDI
jgi:hypothetical protein